MLEPDKPQIEKFRQAARDLEIDEDETRSEERLRYITKQQPKNTQATERPK